MSNQAGWKCDLCRRSGLEKKRRCGWLQGELPPGRMVWGRGGVMLDECPKPYITAESESLVEEFFVRRKFGAFEIEELSARQMEAFVILEKELTAEKNNGRHDTRHTV